MLAKYATIYHVTGLTAESLAGALEKNQFHECDLTQPSSAGFVPFIVGGESLVRTVVEYTAFALRTDTKILPSSVVAEEVKVRAVSIEDFQGYKPGRKQLKEIKELVTVELLAKAFIRTTITRAWVDFGKNILVVDCVGSRVDGLIAALVRNIETQPSHPIRRVNVNGNVALTLTDWIVSGESPSNITIDDRALLIDRAGGKVRITGKDASKAAIFINEHGMTCTELALTYADTVSFVITDNLEFKRIQHLDIAEPDENQTDAFPEAIHDAEIVLNGGTVRDLMDVSGLVFGGLEVIE